MPKDYTYRGMYQHKFSRAYNKAKRGNMTKKEMMETKGRFPKKNEWFGKGTEEEWVKKWKLDNPEF
jgi:hypothetical protein